MVTTHPFPDLQVYPQSGLGDLPWAEYTPRSTGSFTASLGPDGDAVSMTILIFWDDLDDALQRILGYSWRDPSTTPPTLRRVIPWQHPGFNQLYARAVSRVVGIRLEGKDFSPNPGYGGANPNLGPWSQWNLAQLTVEFWRPPYFIRTDASIEDEGGTQIEWLRYLDKSWTTNLQMVSREYDVFLYRVLDSANGPVGGIGQKLTHMKLVRRWYEIPEAAIFAILGADGTPNGLPKNLLYTQTAVTNPVTVFPGPSAPFPYVYPVGSPIAGCVNVSPAYVQTTITGTAGNPVVTAIPGAGIEPGMIVTGATVPPGTRVLTAVGTTITLSAGPSENVMGRLAVFEDLDEAIFGLPMGTLAFEGAELVVRPLQLPATLMQIPAIANSPISQTQYDVIFHFDYYDPPSGPEEPFRGHNLMPYSGNGLFYSLYAQRSASTTLSATLGPFTTPYQYADFSDLFQIL